MRTQGVPRNPLHPHNIKIDRVGTCLEFVNGYDNSGSAGIAGTCFSQLNLVALCNVWKPTDPWLAPCWNGHALTPMTTATQGGRSVRAARARVLRRKKKNSPRHCASGRRAPQAFENGALRHKQHHAGKMTRVCGFEQSLHPGLRRQLAPLRSPVTMSTFSCHITVRTARKMLKTLLRFFANVFWQCNDIMVNSAVSGSAPKPRLVDDGLRYPAVEVGA